MKKYLLLLFTLCFCGICFSQERASDVSIYSNISASYENEYYPGAIEKVDELISLYPDSVFIEPALFIKARALIKLNYYEDAKKTLENVIEHMHTGKDGFTQCHYLLGVANYYLGLYNEALESFYLACKLSLINDEKEYYDSSVFYAAECYYILEDYENAYPLYESVIANGKSYDKMEYTNCVIRLMTSYNKVGLYEKTVALYDSLFTSLNEMAEEEGIPFFDKDTINVLTLKAAEAEQNRGKYNNSYNLYSKVIESGTESLAVIALKNAYLLSEKNLIDVSIGELFSRVSETFKDKKIVDDFWLRLGIDEYNNKNYKKALSYFSNVEGTKNIPIILIYKAKIVLDTDNTSRGANKAREILSEIELPNKEDDNENINDTYYSLLLQCSVQEDKWDDVPFIFSNIENPSLTDIYNNSSSYYRKGEYEKVDSRTEVLYASSLCKMGKYNEAIKVFSSLNNKGKLKKEYYIEWSKALFHIGQYDKAFEIALKSNDTHKDYIAGLCKINSGNIEDAKAYFISYIKQNSNKDDFITLSLYYKGYIEYTLGEYKNAYNTFVRFALEADNSLLPYIRNSHYYAAVSSLQNKDYNSAAKEASLYVDLSMNEEDKIKATIFNFEILNDSKKYDEAVSLLLPYTENNSDFTPLALFMIGGVYGKMGKTEKADSTYKTIYTTYPNSSVAEEAMYKCGEVYYFAKNYLTAYNRFNDYIYKYVNGKYLDAALYFIGDSALKLGEIDKAIMHSENMIAKFPDSVYSYGAYKILLTAFYEHEDFTEALDTAYLIMK